MLLSLRTPAGAPSLTETSSPSRTSATTAPPRSSGSRSNRGIPVTALSCMASRTWVSCALLPRDPSILRSAALCPSLPRPTCTPSFSMEAFPPSSLCSGGATLSLASAPAPRPPFGVSTADSSGPSSATTTRSTRSRWPRSIASCRRTASRCRSSARGSSTQAASLRSGRARTSLQTSATRRSLPFTSTAECTTFSCRRCSATLRPRPLRARACLARRRCG
eukprot:Amastigsp_a343121_5.p3 type:complete len:221 gc:universal Amastigsp_a343121_5:355-1017(+)